MKLRITPEAVHAAHLKGAVWRGGSDEEFYQGILEAALPHLIIGPDDPTCCITCEEAPSGDYRRSMVVCPECGNKRCPRATSHEHTCTGSNESGQPGSRY